MANRHIELFMIRELLRLKDKGHSHSEISQILGISRTTVISYLKRLGAVGHSIQALLDLEEEKLLQLIQGDGLSEPEQHSGLYSRFEGYERELRRTGVTLKRLWQEYKQEDPHGLQYSQFCFHYSRWKGKSQAYMPKDETPGDKLYVDYAGKKLHYIDRDSGEIIPVEVFVAAFGYSDKVYAEVSPDQQLGSFLHSLENSLRFYGGVPNAIVPDNLKSAVSKSSRYEPEVNQQLIRFATHYSTAILPARSRKPKDKSPAENAVKMVYRSIYAAIRNQEFYSIEELNQAILLHLKELNSTKMQKWPHSRNELFEKHDKPALRLLRHEGFEMVKIKWLTVQKNCHIYLSQDKNYYSVPFAYVGKRAKVVYSYSNVEIYVDRKRIAFHRRNHKEHQYITIKEHMPSTHRFVADWNKDKFLEWGSNAGQYTRELFKGIFERKAHPEQAFKSCLGILDMGKKYGNNRLENACKRAVHYGSFNYMAIKNILEDNLDQQAIQTKIKLNIPTHSNIRGGEYYH